MGLIGKITSLFVITALIALLILGYFGFVPVVSDVMGANSPRDLGVSTTVISGSTINDKLGATFTTLPAANMGGASVKESGSQQVNLRLTSEEITALINDHESRWKYYPIEKAQIRINPDDTIELSCILRVDRWSGYADSIGLSESARTRVRPYLAYVQTNPSIYVKGTFSVRGSPQIEISELQVGRINVPVSYVNQYAGEVASFISYVTNLYQLKIDQMYTQEGTMVVVGSIPTEVALSPPADEGLQEVELWAPNREDAIKAFGSVTLVFVVGNLLRAQLTLLSEWLNKLLPSTVRMWVENYISSKGKIQLEEGGGSVYKLTRVELIAYLIALTVFTIAYAYSSSATLEEMLRAIPMVIATSILIEFLKNHFLNIFSRSRGLWAEYRLWPPGLLMFIFSSFFFRTPFSSPSKRAQSKGTHVDLIGGLVAVNTVLIVTALAGVFYYLKVWGISDIGHIGVGMCLISAFFSSIPVPPLNGKTIWDWNKVVSIVLLVVTFFINFYWISYA